MNDIEKILQFQVSLLRLVGVQQQEQTGESDPQRPAERIETLAEALVPVRVPQRP